MPKSFSPSFRIRLSAAGKTQSLNQAALCAVGACGPAWLRIGRCHNRIVAPCLCCPLVTYWTDAQSSLTLACILDGESKLAIAGGCLCGAVRYEIEADAPLGVRQCWCRACQYIGAGSALVGAAFLTRTVTVSGPLTDYVSNADSGAVMHRRFCAECGTPVFGGAETSPHLISVRVGTLDDPSAFAPSSNIWTKSAPTWACFDPSLPIVEGQPRPDI
jgi:hypothetical protein